MNPDPPVMTMFMACFYSMMEAALTRIAKNITLGTG
jgi:hypothetical protein